MKRKIITLILVLAFMTLFAFGCTPQGEKSFITKYDINAIFDDYTLLVDEHILYTNNEANAINSLRLVSHVIPFTDNGNVADNASADAYPFGVNYASFEIMELKANGKLLNYKINDGIYIDVTLPKSLKRGKSINLDVKYKESVPKNRLRYGYNATSINLGNAFIRIAPKYNGEDIAFGYALNGDPFYNEVADFDVSIEYDAKYRAVSTGDYTITGDDKRLKLLSKAQNVRDFAIVLSDDLGVISDTHNGVRIDYMSIPRNSAFGINITKNALDIFGEMYGKYPYNSIAVVENDFVEGGMEYPGLIYVNKNLSDANREKVIIHELAHQWWYGIVGDNENVDYVVDEGMAELSTILYYLQNGESAYANALYKMMRDDYLMYRQYSHGVEVMNRPLNSISDLDYYAMAYLKAPLMLYDIMNDMGKDNFIATCRSVQDKYRYKNITLHEFLCEFGSYGDNARKYVDGRALFE